MFDAPLKIYLNGYKDHAPISTSLVFFDENARVECLGDVEPQSAPLEMDTKKIKVQVLPPWNGSNEMCVFPDGYLKSGVLANTAAFIFPDGARRNVEAGKRVNFSEDGSFLSVSE